MTPATIKALEIAAIVVAGTMTGNEIAVAVFFHPGISRLEDAVHARAAQTLASALGAVMPFWYALTFLLTLLVTFIAHAAWHAMVAGSGIDFGLCRDDHLHRASARAHQQPNCPLETRFSAAQLAGVAPSLGPASCYPSCLFGCRSDSPGRVLCYLTMC